MYVQRYDLNGKKTVSGWPDAQSMRATMEELTRFYAPVGASGPMTAAAHVSSPTLTKHF